MSEYLRRAGAAKRYTPHCLRHPFATQLLNAGVTLEVLKELMGHRSIQNTLKYTPPVMADAQRSRINERDAMTLALPRLDVGT